ncbi:MAG: hypothetical protein AABX16_04775 [Nanoarchaeota archaeon]
MGWFKWGFLFGILSVILTWIGIGSSLGGLGSSSFFLFLNPLGLLFPNLRMTVILSFLFIFIQWFIIGSILGLIYGKIKGN